MFWVSFHHWITEFSHIPITALHHSSSRLHNADLSTPPRTSWPLSIDSVLAFLFEGSGCLGFITAAESHGGIVHGFVREELPLVCQKCNPAMNRHDPALRGKLLRQKCVSVGAPSCPAPLYIFYLSPWLLHLPLVSTLLYSFIYLFIRERYNIYMI